MVFPLALVIIGLGLLPAVYTTIQAFYRVDALDPPVRFIGLRNFTSLFANSAIRSSLVNTALYVVIGVTLTTLIGIGCALALQRPFRGRSAVIAILVLPWALPAITEGLVWSGIYDANHGLVNSILLQTHLTNHYIVLLGSHHLLTITLIEIVQVWHTVPLSALLILASLQLIPGELYEAAQLDGCSGFARVMRITIPLARPGIAIAIVQALVASLNIFDQPYVLNGAASTGASLMMQTYFVTLQNLDFGAGYALSLPNTVATMVLSLIIVRNLYQKEEY
jgi:multiple sugar transport system permease protein